MKLSASLELPVQWRSTGLRIGGAFTLLALVLFTVVGLLSGEQARRNSEQEAGVTLNQLANRLMLSLDTGMYERFREVQNLAAVGALINTEIGAAEWRALIDRLQSTYPYYSWVGVTDAQGVVIAATGGLLEGQDASQRPWFANGKQQPFVGDVHEARMLAALLPKRADGEPIRLVDFSTPLGAGDSVTGVLGAHLSWDWAEERYREVLSSVDSARGIEIKVIGANRERLLGDVSFDLADLTPQVLAALADEPALVIKRNGERYLYSVARSKPYQTYPGLGWYVLVRQPVETALAEAMFLQQRIWAFGILGAALFGLAGAWLARRLTAPLRAVAERAKRVSADLAPSEHRSRDEVTQLSSSIDTLVAQLQRRDRELSGLSDSLDARVDQQTLSLRERNEDLQSFGRSVSHDLKGPIGTMGMVLRHVVEEQGAGLADSPRHLLSEVSRECERLTTLIDELMSLAMVEQGPLSTQPVPMGLLVEQVLTGLRATPEGARVDVQVGALPTVNGDPVLLRQAWQNLISNAFKYSSRSPQPQVRISAVAAGDEVVFTVKDNGVGFDMARADRLFVVFQRLHRASEFQGTGVGLSIVKRVVQRHRGRVGARSAPGEGAEFFFALPVADPPAGPQPPSAISNTSPSP